MFRPAFLALALCLTALCACSTPCQDLATRICDCQPAGSLRDTCVQAVKNQLGGSLKPDAAAEERCTALLRTCADPAQDKTMCDRLKTPQGKEECGIAFPPPVP